MYEITLRVFQCFSQEAGIWQPQWFLLEAFLFIFEHSLCASLLQADIKKMSRKEETLDFCIPEVNQAALYATVRKENCF